MKKTLAAVITSLVLTASPVYSAEAIVVADAERMTSHRNVKRAVMKA